MAYHTVTHRQVLTSSIAVALLVAASVAFVLLFFANLDIPEVYVTTDGKCSKVVNYKNGDAYTCTDKDVTLRKYTTVFVK